MIANMLKVALVLLVSCASGSNVPESGKIRLQESPIVIGHRGAAGYRPEHTIESYKLAIAQKADFIEPDLVMTKDGVLIARHENEISGTTDVSEKFASRKTTKRIDGKDVEGWFTEDFTLAEIKTLRAKERLPFRDQSYNGLFEVPTFAEVLELAKSSGVGVYPETKHPTYFRSIDLPMEDALLAELEKAGFAGKENRVFIQSFEIANLKYLRSKTNFPLVQLIGAPMESPYDTVAAGQPVRYIQMLSPVGLQQIASYAAGLGPNKGMILQLQPSGEFKKMSDLVNLAHQAGLKVHPWTFRVEELKIIVPNIDPKAELVELYKLGVDGIFTDFPDLSVEALPNPR